MTYIHMLFAYTHTYRHIAHLEAVSAVVHQLSRGHLHSTAQRSRCKNLGSPGAAGRTGPRVQKGLLSGDRQIDG